MEFLYSLPIFVMLFYGVIHVAELGFLVGATGETSFYAARSSFIGGDVEQTVRDYSRTAVHPFNKTAEVLGESVDMTVTQNPDGKDVTVDLPYSPILPYAKEILGEALPTISSVQPIPSKGEE